MAFVDYVADRLGTSKSDARAIIKGFRQAILDALVDEEGTGVVKIKGIGSFWVKEVAERKGVSKLSGAEKKWVTPAHYDIGFSSDSLALSYLNTGENDAYLESKGIAPYSEDEEEGLEEDEESGEDSEELEDEEDEEEE